MKTIEVCRNSMTLIQIGQMLRDYRLEEGVSVSDLTEKCNFMNGSISDIEDGTLQASMGELKELYLGLGYKLEVVESLQF